MAKLLVRPPGPPAHPRGAMMIYAVLLMVALMGVASLAVDLGRVHLAKSEMQRAADAASRAAVVHLPNDPAAARSAAVAMAALNTVDGAGFALLASDVSIGKWNPATRALDTASSSPDAVQITGRRTAARGNPIALTFGAVLGRRTFDLTVTHTTLVTRTAPGGFIGYAGFTTGNNLFVAGYDSSVTTSPSQSSYASTAGLGSNAAVAGGNNSDLKGDAVLGPAGSISGIAVTGTSAPRSAALVPPASPAWSPGTNPGGIPYACSVSSDTSLPGGTYWFTSLTVSARVTFTGPATVYINGDANVSGTVAAYNNRPANLKVYVIGSRTVGNAASNFVDITADIEAPDSAFVAKNNMVFRGRMLFETVDVKNNAEFYYDTNLGPAGGATTLSVVAN